MIYPDERRDPVQITLTEPGEDVELKAMAYTWSVLAHLNSTQRNRVVQWLTDRARAAELELAQGSSRIR